MKLWMESVERRVRECATFGELRSLRDQFQARLHERFLFSDTKDWVAGVNHMHDALIARTIALAERQLAAPGHAAPPVPFAFVLLGSGGRREQTLWSDQDNGLIYADGSGAGSELYFAELARLTGEGLRTLGYPPCDGGVVATGEMWRKPVGQWKKMIGEWFAAGSFEDVRHLLIVADIRCVYGDAGLTEELRRSYRQLASATPGIIGGMLRNTLRHKVVLGPFGNLIREQYGEDAGGFDVKYGAYIPMVNAIRLLAVKHGIPDTPTLDRIAKLAGIVGDELAANWQSAFETIVKLRSLTPYQMENGLYTTRGKLKAADLTREVAGRLKDCLHVVEHLQKWIKKSI